MIEVKDFIDFENFPRQPLSFRITRRQILSTITRELLVNSDQGRGLKTPRLADLGILPDDQLGRLIPQIIPDTQISLKQGFIWGKPPNASRARKLIPTNSPAVTAYNEFDGMTTLSAAAENLAQAGPWEIARSFAYTRGVFLWLVWNGVCRPLNPG